MPDLPCDKGKPEPRHDDSHSGAHYHLEWCMADEHPQVVFQFRNGAPVSELSDNAIEDDGLPSDGLPHAGSIVHHDYSEHGGDPKRDRTNALNYRDRCGQRTHRGGVGAGHTAA